MNRKPSKGIQNNSNIIIPFIRKAFIFPALIAAGLAAQSCQQKNQEKNMEEEVTANTTAISAKVASCNVRMDGITFTGALNGADTCVTVKDGRAIEFRCTEKLDFFCDPNGGQLSNTILPILLTEVDNTQPFTLTAKVTPGFTTEGTYNAADLFVYANDTLWQKFAFEQDERGNHRILQVRPLRKSSRCVPRGLPMTTTMNGSPYLPSI